MNKVRLGIQTVFIGLMFYIGYRHQIVGGGPSGAPPLDAYCPFGALATLPTYITTSNFLQKTASSNFWLMLALIITTLFAGAVFCGWICPLGGLSDWFYKIRQKFFVRKIEIPPQTAKVLSYGRFIMLGGIVYFSWVLNRLWFEEYDPYKQIFHLNVESITGWLIIFGFVSISLLVERAWCRFLCPLGAFAGLISRFSVFQIERDQYCINCKKCDRTCPSGIEVSQITRMEDTSCSKCLQCVSVCPVKSLEVRAGFSSVLSKVKPLTFALVSVAVFVGIVGAAQMSGFWNAKSPSIKAVAQLTSVSEIKGWMKWSEVIAVFGVNEEQIITELGLSETLNRNKTIKEIGKEYGFSEEKVRQAIEKYRNH
ncbi:MAG: 4Fe-4S binding protein [Pelosinus sp.]|nr:4Fe-4S binding protein [Pelosinus sp.]